MDHEQSLADEFNKFAEKCAREAGFNINSFSLDGQDRDAGADYVLTDADRFCLIEFKSSEKQFKNEVKKDRRLILCEKLECNLEMKLLHDNCHFITWEDSTTNYVLTNIYRKEICNKNIFGEDSILPCSSSDKSTRVKVRAFTSDFISKEPKNNLSLEQFEIYLIWLLQETSSSKKSTIELVTSNPNESELKLIRLNSIRAAHDWLIKNKPKPKPKSKRKLRF